ncbi:MAG: glutathione S-transferase family protein [Methylobacteriaceae bacterium]|nr:glutathione S-transferase family protein [Methylobacteriaceae bacterium]MBV9244794.1 glutathione S-transferase family protein [Methylobacteriaceae bacterium]MBV9637881.1 glutathione S-transferase family protein [Methylobacteriaceae bacterium]
MSDVIIYGRTPSTYVRTARMTCSEKGVNHTLELIDLGAENYAALHPFRKMPAMRHGDFVLYETAAICRYIDAAFPGPALQPADLKGRARVDQWLSALSDYCYQSMIRDVVLPRVVVPMRGGKTDEAQVAAAVPKVERQLTIIDGALRDGAFLVGDKLTLADLMLVPLMFYIKSIPEGTGLWPKFPALGRWFDAMAGRPSFAATMPDFAQAA